MTLCLMNEMRQYSHLKRNYLNINPIENYVMKCKITMKIPIMSITFFLLNVMSLDYL